ncbi:MAG: glycosyltransferase family 39 protein [Candidatus Dojkabacteria bacterium]|nr:MAG: glycosyltransferase family 39 protein [Candidatus Dojkabacteria bacterium]
MNYKISKKLNRILPTGWSQKFWVYIYPIIIAIAFVSIAFSAVQTKSATVDEKFHLVRGVMLLETGDLRINQHHPYLFNLIHALPTLLDKDIVNPPTDSELWDQALKDELAFEHVELNGGVIEYTKNVLAGPRLLATIITGFFLIAFYWLLRRELGVFIAATATFLLAFSPTLLAHGPLVTTDAPAMITIFLSSWYLYLWIKYSRKDYLIAFVVFAFVALLTKYNAVMLGPIWAAFLLIGFYAKPDAAKRLELKRLMIAAGKVLLVCIVWAVALTFAYKLQFATIYDMAYGRVTSEQQILAEISPEDPPIVQDIKELVYLKIKFPFPQYVHGFLDNVIFHNEVGHDAYLLGESSNFGWWYYFPISFAIKETLPTLFLTIVAFALATYFLFAQWKLGKGIKTQSFVLIMVPALLFALSVSSSLNLGIRHLLPIYPFLFLLIGAMLYEVAKRVRIKYLLTAMMAISFISVLLAYPNYISYFNESIPSRSDGYLYLRSSSYDWEQDLIVQQEYIDTIHDRKIFLKAEDIDGEGLLVQRKVNFFKNYNLIESNRLKVLRMLYENGELETYKEVGDTLIVFEVDSFEIDSLIPKMQIWEADKLSAAQ